MSEYYLAIRNPKVMQFATSWIEQQDTMLSEYTQEKDRNDLSHNWDIKNNKGISNGQRQQNLRTGIEKTELNIVGRWWQKVFKGG